MNVTSRRIVSISLGLFTVLSAAACSAPDAQTLQGWQRHVPRDASSAKLETVPKGPWSPLNNAGRDVEVSPTQRGARDLVWLRVRLPSTLPPRDPALYVGQIRYAGEVYDGRGERRLRFRRLGVEREGRFAGHRWHLVPLRSTDAGAWLYVRVYSSRPDTLGLRDVALVSRAAWLRQTVRAGAHFLVLGLLFCVVGLFALVNALVRRDRRYLAFGLLALATGVLTVFDNRIVQLFASATGTWWVLLDAMPFVSLVGACVLFESIFGEGKRRMVRRLWQLGLIFIPLRATLQLSCWLPPKVDPYLLVASNVLLGAGMFGLLVLILRAARGGQAEARIFALGFGTFGALVLYELFDLDRSLGLPADLYPWGMLVFLFSVGVILERRFRKDAEQLAAQRDKLLEYSRTLEQKVAERTADLDAKNCELEQVNRDLEELVAARTAQLVTQEKTAIIGRMIQGIAHNLKTPLAAMKSTNALVGKKVDKVLADPAAESLAAKALKQLRSLPGDSELIAKAHEQIAAIIDNLMLKSRMDQTLETKAVDLNALIGHELEFFQANPTFKHRVAKTVDLAEGLPELQLVPTNLTQVLENLINNALDAMWQSESKTLAIRSFFDDERVCVAISDSGSGIPSDKLEQIFDPFFTSKPPKGEAAEGEPTGTGLGLHTCVELLRPFGGTIEVDSEVGQGSTFTVVLPRGARRAGGQQPE